MSIFARRHSSNASPRSRSRVTPSPIESLESRRMFSATTLHAASSAAHAAAVLRAQQSRAETLFFHQLSAAEARFLRSGGARQTYPDQLVSPVATPVAVGASPVAPSVALPTSPSDPSLPFPTGPIQAPGGPTATNAPVVGAYSPAQVRTAYGVSSLGLANEGQGVTIGIVDELTDANIASDANAFSAEYGLPKLDGVGGDPTLTVDVDSTLASVSSAKGTGVAAETSLDVEWAHAMAPDANILLVEVPATGSTANEFAELLQGIQAAAAAGADVVSLSYGTSESTVGASTVVSQNNTYLATGAASGVAVAASTGDDSSPLYPATTPDVIAVGGTSLYLASVKGQYSFETAWGGVASAGAGGGGLSTNFASPTFQSANGVSFSKRAIPDVALDADPVTAVSIYDSLDYPTDPWTAEGGTSVATPIFSGMLALAQQLRISAGKSILNSTQVDSAMYGLYDSPNYDDYFHDVTEGKNEDVGSNGKVSVAGFSAATGYDEATGLGSPIASALVPYLASL